jgi:hypothetical protein
MTVPTPNLSCPVDRRFRWWGGTPTPVVDKSPLVPDCGRPEVEDQSPRPRPVLVDGLHGDPVKIAAKLVGQGLCVCPSIVGYLGHAFTQATKPCAWLRRFHLPNQALDFREPCLAKLD